MADGCVRYETGGVDVGGPEEVLVELETVGELGGYVVDGVEVVGGEGLLEEIGVAEVALDTGETGEGRVFVEFEVDVDDGVAFAEESAFEDSAEESRGSGDEDVRHVTVMIQSVPRGFLGGLRMIAVDA